MNSSAMLSRGLLLQQLNDLHKKTLQYKISIHPPDKHPQFEKLRPKDPTAALEIPKQLFLLWSELRRKQYEPAIPVSSHVKLLQNSLEDNDGFTINSPSTELEERLLTECSRTKKKHQTKLWGPQEKLRASLMFMVIYSQEGRLQSNRTAGGLTLEGEDLHLVPKLHIEGNV